MGKNTNFEGLVSQIQYTQDALQHNARLVINRHVTAKAWLTGYYIVKYEQNGADRAKYGDKLIAELSKRLGRDKYGISTLKLYRQFYQTYPMLSNEIANFVISLPSIGQSAIGQLQLSNIQNDEKSQSVISQIENCIVSQESVITTSML